MTWSTSDKCLQKKVCSYELELYLSSLFKTIIIIVGDILAKDFDCNFREVAAADQVNEVRNICQLSSVLVSSLCITDCRGLPRPLPRCARGQEEKQNFSVGQSFGQQGELRMIKCVE